MDEPRQQPEDKTVRPPPETDAAAPRDDKNDRRQIGSAGGGAYGAEPDQEQEHEREQGPVAQS